jgi:hypothetical protein
MRVFALELCDRLKGRSSKSVRSTLNKVNHLSMTNIYFVQGRLDCECALTFSGLALRWLNGRSQRKHKRPR